MVAKRAIQGTQQHSSAETVCCQIYIPTALFHDLHDEWMKQPKDIPFSRYVIRQIEKGRRNDDN